MRRAVGSTNRNHRLALLAVAISAASLQCSGGGGPTTVDPTPATGFAAQIQPIFDASCVRCHAPGVYGFGQTGGESQNGLDLTNGASYRALVNQETFQLPGVPPSFRVRPGSPEESYIIEKLVSDTPKSGQRMPLFGPFLSDAEIQLIRDWIARGAPND